MKQFLNKPCKIHVRINEKDLFFSVKTVIDVSNTHISFVDKFNKNWVFSLDKVLQISE